MQAKMVWSTYIACECIESSSDLWSPYIHVNRSISLLVSSLTCNFFSSFSMLAARHFSSFPKCDNVSLDWFPHFILSFCSILMLELTGLRLGFIGMICLAFLFLPVARGSVLLRYIHIPFEQATRYHVWLGHLTMLLFTLHGLFYVIGWAMQGHLLKEVSRKATPCKFAVFFPSCQP